MSHSLETGYALVTGASSGIGAAIARRYARLGVPLVLVARRRARLDALAAELGALVRVHVEPCDLSRPTAAVELSDAIAQLGIGIRILVNNAGYGVPGRLPTRAWSTHADFLQVMIGSVTELTYRLLPSIRSHGDGRILNVASFAALVPAADGQTLYAPAKAFLLKFSEALSLENADAGVHVTALCPGFTRSEFHDITGTRTMMSTLPGWMWLDADDVARIGIDAVERGQVTVVPGLVYKLLHGVTRHLPQRFLLARMARGSRRIRSIE